MSPRTLLDKRILIPCWVIRAGFILAALVTYSIALNELFHDDFKHSPPLGVSVVFLILMLVVFLMEILAIGLFFRNALRTRTFLALNVAQTSFWVILVCLDLAAIADGKDAGGVWFPVLGLLCFMTLLIFAGLDYHKWRGEVRLGRYNEVANPATLSPLKPEPHYSQSRRRASVRPPPPPYRSNGGEDITLEERGQAHG